jgi:hypothetical protein
MASVAALDRTKEELTYLRFWQGVVVVTDISLAGWSVSAFGNAPALTFSLGIAGVILLTVEVIRLHRQIRRAIARIGEL